MDLKEILSYWKTIISSIIIIVTVTASVLAWAEDQKRLIRAEQQLIHNELYQESRITRKRDQIIENLKIIEALQKDDELSLAQQKFLDTLKLENIRLEKDIEEIRAILVTKHE